MAPSQQEASQADSSNDMLDAAGLGEFVQQTIESKLALVHLQEPVVLEKRLNPLFSQVSSDASGSESNVLIPAGHSRPAAVDEDMKEFL